ncbi:MAG: lytic transglycosylase domain-containing protein [Defluviitaleaceae bacterium]|nr:lytic transglycosylase domain-containing protein [Defluviitaleaceae bacterium]
MKNKKIWVFIAFLFLCGCFLGLLLVRRYLPLNYTDIIIHYAAIYEVDPLLIAAIINVESRFNRTAVSHAGASGLMQIMPNTAYWIAEHLGIEGFVYEDMIFNPRININMGTWYISRLIQNHYNIETALAAYNAGSGNVLNWLNDYRFSQDGQTLSHIPFLETRNYVERVQLVRQLYAFLWRFRGIL